MSARGPLVTAIAVAGCAAPARLPAVHFANAPPVTVVDDRRDVPRRPQAEPELEFVDVFDRVLVGQITRPLELRRSRRALGVNALDEVPDSTWFTNRIGVRELTPDEIRTGPLAGDSPEAHLPWTIHSTKPGGTELGFIITDARGIKYVVKFDDRALPEAETGTHVVVNRLLWACGYNVPEDQIAYVRPDQLVLAPDAEVKDELGHPTMRLDRRGLDRRLATAWRAPDGRLRVMVSRWLGGVGLGGTPVTGVRHGDANDRIPHERRRDLRGQYPIFAWVDHVDTTHGNFPDMWIADPRDPRRHYVEHYKVDFGKSFGVMASTDHYPEVGYRYEIDYGELARSAITLGLAPRPWSRHRAPALTGVSPAFVAAGFDPGSWLPDLPYAPFDEADRFDKFWGARLVARFSRAQIRAAVEAGRFSDPRAVDYLTDTLVARQRATEAYWFARVNPLVDFTATERGLCFTDLAIETAVAPAATTRYALDGYDAAMRPLGRLVVAAAPSGPTCAHVGATSAAPDGYTIVRVTTLRPGVTGQTYVHVARDPRSHAWRVIGIWRT